MNPFRTPSHRDSYVEEKEIKTPTPADLLKEIGLNPMLKSSKEDLWISKIERMFVLEWQHPHFKMGKVAVNFTGNYSEVFKNKTDMYVQLDGSKSHEEVCYACRIVVSSCMCHGRFW